MGKPRMIIIGIVGSPAGGKSTVARRLRELGATWVHADRLAHRVLRTAGVRSQLTSYFGEEILAPNGQIDRSRLAARVFGDDAISAVALNYLESVIHPYARRLTLRRLARATRCGVPAAVLDAPLLLEVDWGVLCDVVWCVDAPEALRMTWITRRGWSLEELRKRERRQMGIAEKRRLSTHVIENDSTVQGLLNRTEELWSQLMDAARERPSPAASTDPEHCFRPIP